ncbi:unnamed protein product [Caenorhabditis bovis]|uniref:Uncharacterized protein n=1 Tax=Caenorhabditis bovis TaxID=2654633 RepID=A0A8S1ELY3_9PELO|nr:unnamed protein product [Caenorhabditis bovis]
MTHLGTRIGHEIGALSSCLQDNMSKCTTSYAPHEEQLVQLDGAKRNLNQLTKLLEARQVFDSKDGQAVNLQSRSIDDSLLPTLLAIGENLKIIKELGAKPQFDVETYHKTKDRYLTWKGTEFAVKFGVKDGLDDIFDAFNTLNSVNDFYRLYQHHFDQSLTSLLNGIISGDEKKSLKDIGNAFVNRASDHFRTHMASLCKYCDDDDAFARLLDAWENFAKSEHVSKALETAIDNYSNYELLTDLKYLVVNYQKSKDDESIESFEKIVVSGLLEAAKTPLAEKLKTMVEHPPLNFRSVSEISSNFENFSYMLKEMASQLYEVYSDDEKPFITSIIKPIFADYTMRLCRMEDNSKERIKIEDYLERIALAGQLHLITEDYKTITDVSSGQELKNTKKWMNDRVRDAIRVSHRFVTDKMPNHGTGVYKEEGSIPKSALPTPSDFVVTATQNLLHLLRFWEEALANETTKLALSIYVSHSENSDKDAETNDEVIFAAILDKIASHVVKKLVQSINDVMITEQGKPANLSKGLLKEMLCDTEYLRDALLDLRSGNHQNLDNTIEKLENLIKNQS